MHTFNTFNFRLRPALYITMENAEHSQTESAVGFTQNVVKGNFSEPIYVIYTFSGIIDMV